MKNNLRIKTCVYAGFGFVASLSLASTLSLFNLSARQSVAYSNSFLAFLFGLFTAGAFVQVKKRIQESTRWEQGVSLIFGIGLSLALTLGQRLETVENVEVTDISLWINMVILNLFFRAFSLFSWQWIRERNISNSKKLMGVISNDSATADQDGEPVFWKEKFFWQNLFLILLCWLPVFLAFYPGAFVYDAQDEYVQVATRNFTTHHPLMHVLLLGGFVAGGNKFFGSYNLGIAGYTIIQMVILAGVFSYTILWLKRRGMFSRWIKWAAALFYGLFPVIPMYAVCSAKDGLFTGAFLIVLLQMLSLFENPEAFLAKKRNWFAGILAAAAMMLLRNNGCYAYVVWIPFALAGLRFNTLKAGDRRKLMLRAFGFLGAGVGLFLLVSTALTEVLQAAKGGSQEIMTVPIQQMARTYKYSPETYSEEEKELLFSLIPEEEMGTYNPRLSDIIKSKFNNKEFKANKKAYLQLWAKVGIRKPMIYLNAWLMTSYGFWYPDAVINVYGGNTVHTFTYDDSSYFGFETENPGIRESKFPWLEEQYRRMSLKLYQQRVPGLSMLFSPGFMFWVFAFCLGFALWHRQVRKVIPMVLLLLLWMTVLLGPTYLVRYVLILWFALPVIVSMLKVCYTDKMVENNG